MKIMKRQNLVFRIACGNIPLTLLEDKEHVEVASFKNSLLPCNRIKSWFSLERCLCQ